ncbi:MAG: GNAT family N-acetyltransferase [Tepidisphaerales bacterium]
MTGLTDGELELVQPAERWIEAVLAVLADPAMQAEPDEWGGITRQSLLNFLRQAPRGHECAHSPPRRVPMYHFWIHLRPEFQVPVPMGGSVTLRAATTEDIEMYYGHIGYGVYPPARGRRLAERACRLLLPLARHHGLNPLWITTDPENLPSRRTCERLGAEMVDIVDVPVGHSLYQRGQKRKCRYRLLLD